MAQLETTSPIRRFRYTSFDGKDEEAPAIALEPEMTPEPVMPSGPLHLPLELPAITEKDVQAAKTEAQALGYREGYTAAQAKFDKEGATREEAVKSLLEIIANRITIAAEVHAADVKERHALVGKLVLAAARKVAGEALKREPYAAVESLLRECMGIIAGEPRVTIIVSSALVAGLKQRIDSLKPVLQGFTGEIRIEEDSHLMDQDCRVEWGNGSGARDNEALWKAIEEIITRTNVNSQL